MNRRQFVESLIAAAALPIDGGRGFLPAPAGAQAPTAPPATPAAAARPSAPTLWYGRAATKWVEALPVGNGRLGAMVFGDVGVERLQVNDDTLWSGGPGGWDTPGAKAALAEVRRLALAGDYAAADKARARADGRLHAVLPAARRSLAHLRARQPRTRLPPRAAARRRRGVASAIASATSATRAR